MLDIVDLIYQDHDWFRRQFFYLDQADTDAQRAAIWAPLGIRLDTHAEAEEQILYPVLLKRGDAGDPEDETEDAIGDHNKIRDAVRAAGKAKVGSQAWWAAVTDARKENGEHLDEEEREALPDFIKSTAPELRRELGLQWLVFYYEHPNGKNVDTSDQDVEDYIEENS